MKKAVFCFFMVICFIFIACGDYKYEKYKNGVIITRYKGKNKDVVIPEMINKLPVVAIGDYAFSRNQLTSITLPNSLTSIGDDAFSSNQLTSITLPNSLTSIGKSAFEYNQLTSITFPNSLTFIGYGAFWFNKLTRVRIPNIATINEDAFDENVRINGRLSKNERIENNNSLSFSSILVSPSSSSRIGPEVWSATGTDFQYDEQATKKLEEELLRKAASEQLNKR